VGGSSSQQKGGGGAWGSGALGAGAAGNEEGGVDGTRRAARAARQAGALGAGSGGWQGTGDWWRWALAAWQLPGAGCSPSSPALTAPAALRRAMCISAPRPPAPPRAWRSPLACRGWGREGGGQGGGWGTGASQGHAAAAADRAWHCPDPSAPDSLARPAPSLQMQRHHTAGRAPDCGLAAQERGEGVLGSPLLACGACRCRGTLAVARGRSSCGPPQPWAAAPSVGAGGVACWVSGGCCSTRQGRGCNTPRRGVHGARSCRAGPARRGIPGAPAARRDQRVDAVRAAEWRVSTAASSQGSRTCIGGPMPMPMPLPIMPPPIMPPRIMPPGGPMPGGP